MIALSALGLERFGELKARGNSRERPGDDGGLIHRIAAT
jgi:hypothetical protein